MKQETKDIAVQAVLSAPTSVAAAISEMPITTKLAIIFFVLQVAYLLRKWWREETEFGMKMKQWVREHTRPSDLSGK